MSLPSVVCPLMMAVSVVIVLENCPVAALKLPAAVMLATGVLFESSQFWRLPVWLTAPFTVRTTSLTSYPVNWPLPVTAIMVLVSCNLPVIVPPLLRT